MKAQVAIRKDAKKRTDAKRKSATVSACCLADVARKGKTTRHYICSTCGRPCYTVPRKRLTAEQLRILINLVKEA